MREILFRGKRLNNGEWVVGNYVYRPKLKGEHYIVTYNAAGSNMWFLVDPATIGQYTGLQDTNGKRIFEGDVVEGHCHSAWSHDLQRCEVAYGRDGFEARHHVNCGDDGWRYYTYRVLFSKDVVVIGNIHDNPELVKEG